MEIWRSFPREKHRVSFVSLLHTDTVFSVTIVFDFGDGQQRSVEFIEIFRSLMLTYRLTWIP